MAKSGKSSSKAATPTLKFVIRAKDGQPFVASIEASCEIAAQVARLVSPVIFLQDDSDVVVTFVPVGLMRGPSVEQLGFQPSYVPMHASTDKLFGVAMDYDLEIESNELQDMLDKTLLAQQTAPENSPAAADSVAGDDDDDTPVVEEVEDAPPAKSTGKASGKSSSKAEKASKNGATGKTAKADKAPVKNMADEVFSDDDDDDDDDGETGDIVVDTDDEEGGDEGEAGEQEEELSEEIIQAMSDDELRTLATDLAVASEKMIKKASRDTLIELIMAAAEDE